jgi:hypothetical protein
MIVVPFMSLHLDGFKAQDDQGLVNKYMISKDYIETIAHYGPAFTGCVDGKPVIFAGMIQPHLHIGMLWAILSEDCKNHMIGATRAIKEFLDKNSDIPRMETAVKRGFKEGARWAEMLGFVNETPETGMKNYSEDGQTYDLYARCR